MGRLPPGIYPACAASVSLRRVIAEAVSLRELVEAMVGGRVQEELAVRAEDRLEVQRWLATLPESYHLVLILRYWHELSYNEISETIGQPVSTVRMRLFRARQSLGKSCRIYRYSASRYAILNRQST